ncbi:MAG: hypothetical protein VYE29_08495 [Pseudomonadota bacterium]|nr:hypothetical protein [Pseudomonadota bacterium]MEC9086176.1 hypothetical protein [Pseudomonadota bacterium]
MINVKTLGTVLLLAFSISVACADEVRRHTFDSDEIDRLDIDTNVGTLLIEQSDSGSIEVEVVIKAEDSRWSLSWFDDEPDLSKVDIESRVHAGELNLGLDADDVSADWVIRIPDLDRISIQLAVGTVEIVDINSEFDIQVGVGTIDIETSRSSTGRITASAGVGDTRVRGASDTESQRVLVSSDTSGTGDGDRDLSADVGVGDIRIALR